MTNRDKYQKTFSHLKMEKPLQMEDLTMNRYKKTGAKSAVVFGTLAALLTGSSIAFAADAGGIRTSIETYLYGEKKTVEVVDNGQNGYIFYDGSEGIGGGGGIAYENGKEVPLSAQEVLEDMNRFVDLKEDGTLLFYDDENTYDLTALIEENEVHAVFELKDGLIYYDIEIAPDGSSVSYSSSRKPKSDPDLYTLVTPEQAH